ncbi:hypothetical protein NKI04_26360 [Mesorhizobium sp. M0814]|uniref:hypothetical protein n=1 Tax=Mesorhizobium sp. M0814 TaxID=2957004 RepID=UPI00333C5192
MFEEAKKQVGSRGDDLDRMIEEHVHGVGRAFWRDVERASCKSANEFLTQMGVALSDAPAEVSQFRVLGRENYDIHIIADGAGILLMRDMLRALTDSHRKTADRLLPRIASLDLITPVIDRTEFEQEFIELVRILSQRGAIPGGGSRCALHVPHRETEQRLAVGLYSKSILELIENAFCDRHEVTPVFIGKSTEKTGLRHHWTSNPAFSSIDISDINVVTGLAEPLEQHQLQSRTKLLESILQRIAPVTATA